MLGKFRAVAPMAKQLSRGALRAPALARPSVALFSSLEDKGRGEEAKYFKALEAQRQAELRAKIDKIMALEDNQEHKQELVELLEKTDEKKEKKGFWSLLSDWKFALPMGLVVSIPMIHHELLLVDEELILLCSFLLFAATMHAKVGPIINESIQATKKEILDSTKDLDHNIQSKLRSAIEENQQIFGIKEKYESLVQVQDQLAVLQAETLNHQEEHKYRDAIEKKLDALVALEETASNAIRSRMVTAVKNDVINTFNNDKAAKEDALAAAIAVLSAGNGAKLGKDVVGGAFKNAVVNYREKYAKLSPEKDEILVQLQKDMAAVANPPATEDHAGNVYVTHPIM